MSKTPELPVITSDFALLDIKKGRAALEKIVGASYRIPVVITGYIQNGKGGVGGDDGVSREFSIDVEHVQMDDPEFVPADNVGRPWALKSCLHEGGKITLDGGFTCVPENEQRTKRRTVKKDKGGLYFRCGEGKHYLDGQLGEHGEYVGVYKVGK